MNDRHDTTAVLVVGHGSPRPQANAAFIALVERIAARLVGLDVLPAFFSIARPSIEDRVAELAGRGVCRIVLMPYFLSAGQHVSRDIPELLDRCRASHPGIDIEVLPTLEGEPAIEDLVVERLAGLVDDEAELPADGAAIERRSMAIIDAQLAGSLPGDAAGAAIVRRVVHATADLSFARSLRIHPEAARRGVTALKAGRPIICDVNMLAVGITRSGAEVLCAIGDPAVARAAGERGCTRAAAGVEALADRIDGAIVAVGNAPTALFKVLELAGCATGPAGQGGQPRVGRPIPALVVGLPVGFVGASQSKRALLASGLCYVTNVGPRGGSPVAAAAVNAIAALRREGSVNDA